MGCSQAKPSKAMQSHAKPIIDIVIGVAVLKDAEKMITGMESIGYDYPDDIGIPGDRIFGRDPNFRCINPSTKP